MKKTVELIGNTALAASCLAAGVYFFGTENQELCPFLFGIALACILYQFLGGIGDQNSIQLGVGKFTGAAAILVGFMLFLQKVLFVPPLTVTPPGWIPISSETLRPITVTIEGGGEKETYGSEADKGRFAAGDRLAFQLSKGDSAKYNIELANSPLDRLGSVDVRDFQNAELFNKTSIARDDRKIHVFTLYPFRDTINSSEQIKDLHLPFEIKVFPSFTFSIEPYIKNRPAHKRQSFIIPGTTIDTSWVVFLEQSVARNTPQDSQYTKWLVGKTKHTLE